MMTSEEIKTADNTSQVSKKDLIKMAVNHGALGMEFSWNYPRQMHLAFCLMINPFLKKFYKNDKKGYADALTRHIAFFNITPQLAPFVGGVAVSMEEKIAKGEMEPESVNAVKAALMGPLSGIGDSIFLGCIRVIALGVGLSLVMQGNILGPILYALIYNIPAFLVRIFGAVGGYELGMKYLQKAQETGAMDKLVYAAGILGIMVIGAMSNSMVYTTLGLKIGTGEAATTLQEILDSILPGALGLGATWLFYWLLKKKVSPMVLIIGTIIVGVLGAYLGIFAA